MFLEVFKNTVLDYLLTVVSKAKTFCQSDNHFNEFWSVRMVVDNPRDCQCFGSLMKEHGRYNAISIDYSVLL